MKDGEIRPLPQNEFYQSPFDGRWVDLDEEEVFRLIDMQRQSGTRCGKTNQRRVILEVSTRKKPKLEYCLISTFLV